MAGSMRFQQGQCAMTVAPGYIWKSIQLSTGMACPWEDLPDLCQAGTMNNGWGMSSLPAAEALSK